MRRKLFLRNSTLGIVEKICDKCGFYLKKKPKTQASSENYQRMIVQLIFHDK